MTTNSLKVRKFKRGEHPNSLKNLEATKFPKGVSGNAGSGNGYSVTAEVKHILKEKPRRVAIAERMVSESEAGNVPMLKELLDRTEGKVPDKTAIIGDILIEVVFRDINSGKAQDDNSSSSSHPAPPTS